MKKKLYNILEINQSTIDNGYKKIILRKINRKRLCLLLLLPLLNFSSVAMAKGNGCGYSLDTNFRNPLFKYDVNIDNHPIPSIYDEEIRHLYERNNFVSKDDPIDFRMFSNSNWKNINSLHSDVLWMLFIDGQHQDVYGPMSFDYPRYEGGCYERGYLKAISTAFRHVFNPTNIQKPLNADYYLKIHKMSINNVELGDARGNKNTYDSKSYRTFGQDVSFPICDGCMGLKEYLMKKDSEWKSDKIVFQNERDCTYYQDYENHVYELDKNGRIFYQDEIGQVFYEGEEGCPFLKEDCKRYFYCPVLFSSTDTIRKVNVIFEEYYSKLDEIRKDGFAIGSKLSRDASEEDKILEVIIRICQNLDQLHAFRDGNIRTIGLVLEKMLVENGLSPTVLYDPNCLDMGSVNELITEVKDGQKKFQKVLEISRMLYDEGIDSNKSKTLDDLNDIFEKYIKNVIADMWLISK